MQQLVEAVALAFRHVPPEGVAGLHELQAVSDRDVGQGAALGREDDRKLLSGPAAGKIADPCPGGAGLQPGEPAAIPQPGHFPAERELDGTGEQPGQAGTYGLGIDHLAEPERHRLQELLAASGVAAGGEPVRGGRAAVCQAVADDLAGLPALLPGVPGVLFQPVHETPQRDPALPQRPGGLGIGRGQQPARQRRPAQGRRLPGARDRPGRVLLQQGGCGLRPHPGAQRRLRPLVRRHGGGHPRLPNSTSSDSGRYPGAAGGGAAGFSAWRR